MNIFSKTLLVCCLVAVMFQKLSAQSVGINADNSDPDPTAMLDVKSDKKGILIPRMTAVEMLQIVAPATGLLIYNTTTESFWYKKTSNWLEIGSPSLIQDTDKNTKVLTEKTPNDDLIRFEIAGAEKWVMRGNRLEPKNASNSVFIGNEVGEAGANNIEIGYQAGQNASGSGNIFIGPGAGKGETGSNKIVIGSLLSGDQSTGLLKINNSYTLPASAGNTGQVLQAAAGGSTTWGPPVSGLPSGTILPFGGPVVPAGFLACDGSAVNKTTYPDLFAAIGTSWGGDGIANFNLPDLRGNFLRGWSNGSGVDPDATGRTSNFTGGATGDKVGSYQLDAFQGHHHALYLEGTASETNAGKVVSGDFGQVQGFNNVKAIDPINGNHGQIKLSTETRPKNAYVNYIIKY